MRRISMWLVFVLAVFAAGTAFAAQQTVALDIPGMTCALCPLTIKKALQKVPGVERVEASFEKTEAIVTFDDAKTGIAALTNATKDAGYPSTLKSGK